MKQPKIIILLFTLLASSTFAQIPSQNSVVLKSVEKYQDFAIDSRKTKRDTERLINDLKNQIQKTIKRIFKQDHLMHITILDVDMAGIVSPLMDDRSIVSHLDSSVLVFKYKIFDTMGNILKQDKIILEDKILHGRSLQLNRFRNSYFKYELVMFSKWLNKIAKFLK